LPRVCLRRLKEALAVVPQALRFITSTQASGLAHARKVNSINRLLLRQYVNFWRKAISSSAHLIPPAFQSPRGPGSSVLPYLYRPGARNRFNKFPGIRQLGAGLSLRLSTPFLSRLTSPTCCQCSAMRSPRSIRPVALGKKAFVSGRISSPSSQRVQTSWPIPLVICNCSKAGHPATYLLFSAKSIQLRMLNKSRFYTRTARG